MDQQSKTKFCLSRVEEYYYEENVDETSDEEDYSTICNLIHQRALSRAKKAAIQNKLDLFYERPEFNYTNDSLYVSNSEQSLKLNQTASFHPNSISFNQKRFDQLYNNVN